MINRVAIIGSHGLYANYGGWDQLVNNLAEKKSRGFEYLIFNSSEAPKTIKRIGLKASGFQGIFYDFWSILICYWKVDTILLLGTQGIPLIIFLLPFKKVRLVSNVGGIEWERPKFGFFSKLYLKICFNLSTLFSDFLILDNPHYKTFLPHWTRASVHIIPYGGTINVNLNKNIFLVEKYPFLENGYFLSISRALEDNMIMELCESFVDSKHKLVLISNLSSSNYGKRVLLKYKDQRNITLINGLYIKPELDLIRRNCVAYIHTHTLCGTAPSLVEMIIAQKPIISSDIPQNRFTLHEEGFFYKRFSEIQNLLVENTDLGRYIPSKKIADLYDWKGIVRAYEDLYNLRPSKLIDPIFHAV